MRIQWEFSCTEVPGGNVTARLKHLQTLGDDGWEPFHMQYIQLLANAPGKMIVFCKRPIHDPNFDEVEPQEQN